jgi:hypothetical protein
LLLYQKLILDYSENQPHDLPRMGVSLVHDSLETPIEEIVEKAKKRQN